MKYTHALRTIQITDSNGAIDFFFSLQVTFLNHIVMIHFLLFEYNNGVLVYVFSNEM